LDSAYLFDKRKTILIFMGAMLGTMLTGFTIGMLGTSLPQIVGDLGGLQYLAWVMTAYLLLTSVTVPLWGKVTDIYGRRVPFTASLAFFTAGALACAVAPTMPILILGRVIMGVGAGGMVPISIAITADLMSPRERGKWLGIQQVIFGATSILAPVVGGRVTDTVGWRWNFFGIVGLGVLCVSVAWFAVRIPRPTHSHRLDYAGASLIMLGAGTLFLAVTWGGVQYGWTSPLIVAMLISAAILLTAFVVWELRVGEPIFPLSLFRNRTFAMAQIGVVGTHSVLLVTLTLAPLLIQGVLGLSATQSGSLMIGYGVSSIAAGLLVGILVSRTGRYRAVLVISPIILAVSCYMLGELNEHSSPLEAAIDLILVGIGVGTLNGTLTVVVQNAVSVTEQGVASAAMAFTRIMAGALAVAVVGAVMTARVGAEIAQRLPGAQIANLSVSSLVDTAGMHASTASPVLRQAFIAGAPGAFLILLPLLAVTVLTMVMIEKRDLRMTLLEPD
jgi:EmrB/QacA subfamily drug resistance transporter